MISAQEKCIAYCGVLVCSASREIVGLSSFLYRGNGFVRLRTIMCFVKYLVS
uniref:Uncharacterized protein n=1 Tax=Arundo donax TaxID=35708 RepID=A0A0A9C9U0_ARUDO